MLFLFKFISSFHFSHHFPSKYQSLSLATGCNPSLFISLPVYRWVRVSLSCPSICLSVCLFVRARVSLSLSVSWGRGGGGKLVWKASLPAWLLIQYLCGVVHLCEALWGWAGAHGHFLWLLELHQDVSDLPLSTLEEQEIKLMQVVRQTMLIKNLLNANVNYCVDSGEKIIRQIHSISISSMKLGNFIQ